MFLMIRFQILVVFFVSGVSATEIGLDFFEAKIRPVLVDKCYGCHSVDAANRGKLKGGLFLDTKKKHIFFLILIYQQQFQARI